MRRRSTFPKIRRSDAALMNSFGDYTGDPGTEIITHVPAGGIAIGRRLVVFVATDTEGEPGEVVDARGNVYTEVTNQEQDGATLDVHLRTFLCPVTVALVANDIIGANVPFSLYKTIAVLDFAGIGTGSVLDQVSDANGASANPASGAVVISQATEILAGCVAAQSATLPAFSPGANWLSGTAIGSGEGGAGVKIWPLYRIVSAFGSYEINGTLGAAADWCAAIVTMRD